MTLSVAADLDRLVPLEERKISIVASMSGGGVQEFFHRITDRSRVETKNIFSAVSTWEVCKMTYRLVRSQAPGHDPEHQPLPAFADVWFAAYERGVDVTRWYGSRTLHVA
jgi:hypothetical protein